MTTSHDRLRQLLERWQASVDRHTRYLALDDAAYAAVEDWPKHQRPARWVVEHARERLAELRRIADARRERGDGEFADALEQMAFLANLVGAEHVERHIPLARGGNTDTEPTVVAPKPARSAPRTAVAAPASGPARSTAGTVAVAAPPPARPAPARPRADKATARPRTDKAPKPDRAAAQVIADAARLLSWGREWPQLAGLIARMADRPPEPEVWSILRTHRSAIVARARRAPE